MTAFSPPPPVSVMMALHNTERYVQAAVESILNQTFPDFELIVVDDGSTDRSAEIVEAIARRDRRVRLIRQSNHGISATRNILLRESRAELLAVMDSDDISLPERLAWQVAFLHENPACVAVGCQVMAMDSCGRDLGRLVVPLDHATIDKRHMAGLGGAIANPVAMLRAASVRQVGYYATDKAPAEDLDMFLRLAEVGRLANLPGLGLRYRLHSSSASTLRARTQAQHINDAVREAHLRRGLAPPPQPSLPERETASRAATYQRWVGLAKDGGNTFTAWRYALLAVLTMPWKKQSWLALSYAMAGQHGTALLVWLKRWLQPRKLRR